MRNGMLSFLGSPKHISSYAEKRYVLQIEIDSIINGWLLNVEKHSTDKSDIMRFKEYLEYEGDNVNSPRYHLKNLILSMSSIKNMNSKDRYEFITSTLRWMYTHYTNIS